jgi:hypothetical protein
LLLPPLLLLLLLLQAAPWLPVKFGTSWLAGSR